VFQDYEQEEDPEINQLVNTLTLSNSTSNRLSQTNVSLEKLKIEKGSTMAEARGRLRSVLKDRELRACGFGSK